MSASHIYSTKYWNGQSVFYRSPEPRKAQDELLWSQSTRSLKLLGFCPRGLNVSNGQCRSRWPPWPYVMKHLKKGKVKYAFQYFCIGKILKILNIQLIKLFKRLMIESIIHVWSSKIFQLHSSFYPLGLPAPVTGQYICMKSLNDFSETAGAIFTTFHMKLSVEGGLRVCSYTYVPLIKMAAMPHIW